MNPELLDTLRLLKTDPTVVVRLYGELYRANYFALIQPGTGPLAATAAFLTYDTIDGVRELPLFTAQTFVLGSLESEATPMLMEGPTLWSRLVDLIETKRCEVGIDPGQGHSIRLNKEMVLGMIAMYSSEGAPSGE